LPDSANHEKEAQMKSNRTTLYRFLSGIDDSSFCHKVSQALSQGWLLYGAPVYAHDPVTGTMRCGQVVIREVDAPYDPERKLTDY
jgi:hypothetical protein